MYALGLSPIPSGSFTNFTILYIKNNNLYIQNYFYEYELENYLKVNDGFHIKGEIIELSDFIGFDKYGNFHIIGQIYE